MGDELPEKYTLTPLEGEPLDHSHGFTGEGTAAYTNGDTFTGHFSGGHKQGAGVYTYANGDKFEGSYDKDRRVTGKVAVFTFAPPAPAEGQELEEGANGGVYTGTFGDDGKFGGEGTMVYANGDVYSGSFSGGKKHGFGRYAFANTKGGSEAARRGYSYEGEWTAGTMTSGRWVLQGGDASGATLNYNDQVDRRAKEAGGNGADGNWARQKNGIWYEGGFAADGTPNGEGAWHFGAGHTVVGEFASSVKPRHGELTKAETASVVAGTFTDETTSLTWKTAGVVEGA